MLMHSPVKFINNGNYLDFPLVCPIAALKMLIYTYKLCVFALLLNKLVVFQCDIAVYRELRSG